MDKQHPRLDVVRILHAIDGDGDFCHAISSPGEQDVFPGANLGLPAPETPVPSRVPISDTRTAGPAQRVPAEKFTVDRRVIRK
jgi:hypothetical protein